MIPRVKFKVVQHIDGKWYVAREERGKSAKLIGPYIDKMKARQALPILKRGGLTG